MPSFTTQIPNLQQIGPVIEVLLSPPKNLIDILKVKKEEVPQPVRLHAMIDTGATNSVVNPAVIKALKINPIGVTKINTPSSVGVECYQYKAGIIFPNNVFVETSELIEAPLQGQHIQCLIGRDILKHGVLIYNGYMRTVTFSL